MSAKPIIDAGPALNFLAINQERLLFRVLGRISTPEAVEVEVLRKSRTDRRFDNIVRIWSKVTPKYIEVLSDDWTAELETVFRRLTQLSLAERRKQAKDFGELMVVAHAAVLAEQGFDATTAWCRSRQHSYCPNNFGPASQ